MVVALPVGTVTLAEPLLGTPVAKVIGYVYPPSWDKKISTFGVFTAPVFVPATFHVTVSVLPSFHVTAVFCEVTVNGPELPSTVTTIWSILFCPPPERLSLTVSEKFIVLPTLETVSHWVVKLPATTLESCGMYLFGEVVGAIDRKAGLPVLVALTLVWELNPTSPCSQQNESESTSGSEPLPSKIKAVPFGIV